MVEPKYPVRSVDRTLDILEIIQEHDGMGVSEIANHVDIGKSAVHNHLTTLINREYVVKGDGEYHIGLSFLGLGAYARSRMKIYEIARPEVEKLANETDELATLVVEHNGRGIYLCQAAGKNAIQLNAYGGKPAHLHCTAPIRAILAFRPSEEVESILDGQKAESIIKHTVVDREAFLEDLPNIREQGYAVDHEEGDGNLGCVAAPITDENGRGIAAVSVVSPTHRVSNEWFKQKLPDIVLQTGNTIELNHNYS